jgi:Flp pilus assembly protein TadD
MALAIQPDDAATHNNLGNALFQKGRVDEAIAHFQKAIELHPELPNAHNNLGNVLLQKGRVDEAIIQYQKALEIQPVNAEFHHNLGYALFQKGQTDEAIAQLQEALEIRPDQPKACYNLARVAWELATSPEATVRNGAKAVALAEQVVRLSGGKDPMVIKVLAAAYAEAGRFAEAVATAERAQQLAAAQNNTALVNALQVQIGCYQAGAPFRDVSQTNVPTHPGPP